jgi:hypothetical protein
MRNLAAFSGLEVELIVLQLQDFRRQGQTLAAESLKARFTYRMFDFTIRQVPDARP